MTQKLICPECGAENPEDAIFCEVCHTSLVNDDSSTLPGSQQSDQDDFDLLNTADDDLPGLLHALKQEDENLPTGDEMSEDEGSLLDSEDLFEQDEGQDSDDIPDWLHRIRQRANEEEDSVGEITQKISAAKESLDGSKRSSQHESFESWIQKLRGPIRNLQKEQPEESPPNGDLEEELEEEKSTEPEWLQKIRQAEGKLDTSDSEGATGEGESGLLNWLDSLEGDMEEKPVEEIETEEEGEKALDERTQQIEVEDAGVTQEVPVDDQSHFKAIPPRLKVTNEEQILAEKLTSTIMDEDAPRPIRKIKRRSPLGAARFFFAILLIATLSIALFLGQRGPTQLPSIQPQAEGFLTWAEGISPGSSLLLVFDYQPAFSSEINLVARPVLDLVAAQESEISVISSSLSGPILYRQLFQQVGRLDPDSVVNLGYYPIGAYAAFDLGMGFSASWRIIDLPGGYKELPKEGFDGIIILADTYEGARAWIEQLTILIPETPINLLVADQAKPMLLPYFDSGQISGMVSGFNGAAILEAELSQDYQTTVRWWAYQIGTLLLMVVIVIGAIYAGNQHKADGGEK